MLVAFSPDLALAANVGYYEGRRRYTETPFLDRGLFPFEERQVLAHYPKVIPGERPPRVLVHAVGAGREALGLCRMGYEVVAFDPVPRYVEQARDVLRGERATVDVASIEGWARSGDHGPYDAAFIGWSAWSYMFEHATRLEVLRAFRTACPNGALIMSFFRAFLGEADENNEKKQPLHPPPSHKLDRFMRKTVRETLLRRSPLERGTDWLGGLYVHYVADRELDEEAEATGYRVAYFEKDMMRVHHAVLVPA
jgi:hypothetical protein